MNTELKIPKFVEEFSNYLIAIRNLSDVYIKNFLCLFWVCFDLSRKQLPLDKSVLLF